MTTKGLLTKTDTLPCPISIVNGCVVANVSDKSCLIDTGCPATFGDEAVFTLFGNEFRTSRRYGPWDCEEIGEHVGTHLDFLVGTDVLCSFPWRLDWKKKEIEFHDGGHPFDGTSVRCSSLFGTPVVHFVIGGRKEHALLDTGPALQYCPSSVDLGPAVRQQQDYNPFLGEFTAPVYKADFKFGNRKIGGEFGKVPSGLDGPLGLLRLGFILGSDVLRSGPVGFDLRRGKRRIHLL